MELANLVMIFLGIVIFLIGRKEVNALPPFSDVDGYIDRSDNDYFLSYREPVIDYRLSKLRRGYYYIDDGFIAPVDPSGFIADKRSDRSNNERKENVQYNPLVSYKQTHTKRKKLFVPNLYG